MQYKQFAQDSDFQFGTGICIPQRQFWSAEVTDVAPLSMTDPDILAPLCLGFLLGKTRQISKEAGSEKNEGQITIETRQSFPWLARKGKVYFPTSCSVLWRLWHESLWTFIFGCETLHPAQPHLTWLNLLFLPLVGESGCAQASCWDVLGSHLPQREKCVGEATSFGMMWQKKLSLKKVVKRVANLTSSGAATISSVNFSAAISEANKLQWEGI